MIDITDPRILAGRDLAQRQFNFALAKWDAILLAEHAVKDRPLPDQRVILQAHVDHFRALTMAARFDHQH